MAGTYITEVTIDRWDNRESANYVPCNDAIGNIFVDGYGRTSTSVNYLSSKPRPAYKVDTATTAGTIYKMFDSDKSGTITVPIIRIREV